MNISDNVRYISDPDTKWNFFTNKSYPAKLQKGDSQKEYNVPGQKGVVYNCLEDAYEKVTDDCYVVTGIVGEMWPIPARSLKKYDISPDAITYDPQTVYTVETDDVYAAIRIPVSVEFTVEVDYGVKVILKGNRPGIGHGEGDYILVAAKETANGLAPDLSDSGRIINGAIFNKIYKPRCDT